MPLWTNDIAPRQTTNLDSSEVVATEKGWVNRTSYTDTHGNVRQKDILLVSSKNVTVAPPEDDTTA